MRVCRPGGRSRGASLATGAWCQVGREGLCENSRLPPSAAPMPAHVYLLVGMRVSVSRTSCCSITSRAYLPRQALTPAKAAEAGHLLCLKFARQHECPWDELTTAAAAGGGFFDCLRYAREYECPWDAVRAVERIERSAVAFALETESHGPSAVRSQPSLERRCSFAARHIVGCRQRPP